MYIVGLLLLLLDGRYVFWVNDNVSEQGSLRRLKCESCIVWLFRSTHLHGSFSSFSSCLWCRLRAYKEPAVPSSQGSVDTFFILENTHPPFLKNIYILWALVRDTRFDYARKDTWQGSDLHVQSNWWWDHKHRSRQYYNIRLNRCCYHNGKDQMLYMTSARGSLDKHISTNSAFLRCETESFEFFASNNTFKIREISMSVWYQMRTRYLDRMKCWVR